MSKSRTLLISIVIIAAIALIGAFVVRHYIVLADTSTLSPVDFPVRGIDISAHNGNVDFDAVKSDGISFVYIKASEGGTFKDPRFFENVTRARRAGLKVGAYHFFRFNTGGMAQALNFIHSVASRPLDMPLAIDLEEWTNDKNMHTDSILFNLTVMIDHLKQSGLPVIIYTNKDGYDRFYKSSLHEHPLWICSLSTLPRSTSWTFWQHSHSSRIDGITTPVDVNVFNADSTTFNQWCDTYIPLNTQ